MGNGNLSFDELLKIANAGRNNSGDEMLKTVESRLSDEKKRELNKILSDKNALEALLSSDRAKQLIKKFGQNG